MPAQAPGEPPERAAKSGTPAGARRPLAQRAMRSPEPPAGAAGRGAQGRRQRARERGAAANPSSAESHRSSPPEAPSKPAQARARSQGPRAAKRPSGRRKPPQRPGAGAAADARSEEEGPEARRGAGEGKPRGHALPPGQGRDEARATEQGARSAARPGPKADGASERRREPGKGPRRTRPSGGAAAGAREGPQAAGAPRRSGRAQGQGPRRGRTRSAQKAGRKSRGTRPGPRRAHHFCEGRRSRPGAAARVRPRSGPRAPGRSPRMKRSWKPPGMAAWGLIRRRGGLSACGSGRSAHGRSPSLYAGPPALT